MTALLTLDTLSGLSGIFIFLFVWVLVYGLLGAIKPFGDDRQGLYAIIALAMGVLVGMNAKAIKVFTFFTSWFSIIIILIFFILLGIMVFGVKMDDITNHIKNASDGRTIVVWIVILSIVIMAIGLALNVGQGLLEEQPGQSTATQGQTALDQGTVVVVDPNSGAQSQYDYDYRTDRGMQTTQVQDTSIGTTSVTGTTNSGNFESNFVTTLFHPKVLGLAMFILIGLFASLWLTEAVVPK